MSFDLSASLERDLEEYARTEHITPTEAAVKFIQSGLKAKRRKAEVAVVTDSDVEAYYKALPGIKALEDVTDEQWDRVLKNARRMSKQGNMPALG